MIRVLVADDSPTARGLIATIVASAADMAVIAEANNGEEAVRMAVALRPDIILIDLHMPVLNGLGATRQIMEHAPVPILIITSDGQAVAESLRAIEAGALDLVPKPPGPNSAGFKSAARRLVMLVRAMAGVKVVRRRQSSNSHVLAPMTPSAERQSPSRIIAIAASTGGPAALQCVLGALPERFPVPIVIVQHMSRTFTVGLVSWLDAQCAIRVKIGEAGEPALPGVAYVAPDDWHLGVLATESLTLGNGPPIAGFRPSATAMFRSVATAFGPASTSVILSGMGDDGVEGLRTVRNAGGRIIAQDESTSIVFGMPGAAIAAGLVDLVLPLGAIASKIIATSVF